MTKEELIDQLDGAPYELDKVAWIISDCDDPDIARIGQDYYSAEQAIYHKLKELGIELG